jgi:hypothetical protein
LVQALLSLHAVPFATGVWLTPVVALQASVVHGLLSLTTGAVPATQVPAALHVSWPLHTVASSHAVPLATGVWVTPVVGLQASVVHGLLSFVTSGVPATQVPVALQVSWPLHTVASSHAVPLANGVWVTTPADVQESVVQGLPSLALASQQTPPLAQNPVAHWLFEVQVTPNETS